MVGLVFLPRPTKAFCRSVNADWVGILLADGGDTSTLHVVTKLVWTFCTEECWGSKNLTCTAITPLTLYTEKWWVSKNLVYTALTPLVPFALRGGGDPTTEFTLALVPSCPQAVKYGGRAEGWAGARARKCKGGRAQRCKGRRTQGWEGRRAQGQEAKNAGGCKGKIVQRQEGGRTRGCKAFCGHAYPQTLSQADLQACLQTIPWTRPQMSATLSSMAAVDEPPGETFTAWYL